MAKATHVHPADLHGAARLAAEATSAITDIVEAVHAAILSPPFAAAVATDARTGLPFGLPYSGVRGVARAIGSGLDLALAPLIPLLGERLSTPERDAFLSILNGVVGDHLAQTGNPLAVEMQLRRRGLALEMRRDALAESLPSISPRIAVLLHGLCGTDAQWKRARFDYGAALQRELGFTPVYLRYNSGLHVSTNGRQFAGLLARLVEAWPLPVEEVLLVGHSMGGLVARSAVHYGKVEAKAGASCVRRIAFLGTPHHGAPLERGGNWFEEVAGSIPYAGPLSRLGRLRSSGITDLRHGNLVDEDWQGSDRFERSGDRRVPIPLPDDVDCLAIAATTGASRGDARDRLVGDGLVPVASALGQHADPLRDLAFDESRRVVVYRTHHIELLGDPEVWEHLSRWLA